MGIGQAVAVALAGRGIKVGIADVEDCRETCSLIEATDGEALSVTADVSKGDQVEAFIEQTVRQFGGLDYAVNNAGILGTTTALTDYSEAYWDQINDINLKGIWHCMRYEIPHMLARGGGSIVNTSSAAGLIAAPLHGAYTASKHGVIGLTKSAALDYAKAGIRVNAVCPGPIDTPGSRTLVGASPELEDVVPTLCPMGRLGTAAEVAAAVVWLCSDEASFVTGTAVAVDGGVTAQ
jgi:NAD(P)-dependent dehydrogenase (short-subunit alcohol dehydrogenase family)